MRTKDVAYHIMHSDLHRAMKELFSTSKEELTREVVARTWDETVVNSGLTSTSESDEDDNTGGFVADLTRTKTSPVLLQMMITKNGS